MKILVLGQRGGNGSIPATRRVLELQDNGEAVIREEELEGSEWIQSYDGPTAVWLSPAEVIALRAALQECQ